MLDVLLGQFAFNVSDSFSKLPFANKGLHIKSRFGCLKRAKQTTQLLRILHGGAFLALPEKMNLRADCLSGCPCGRRRGFQRKAIGKCSLSIFGSHILPDFLVSLSKGRAWFA